MFTKIIVFFLRPFVGLIRYGALKIMKKFHSPNDKRPVIATSDHILNEIVLPSVFNTFRENKFRELAYFKKLPVSEHDRIFNELEVAGICLTIFYLHAIKPLVKPDNYHFWQDVEEYLPKQLQRALMNYGVDGSNAKLLKQLVEMRREEYEKLAEKICDVSSNKETEFKNLPLEMKRIAAVVQATAVGAADHIRRGKIQEKDPLMQYLVEQLLFLQKKIGKFVKNL